MKWFNKNVFNKNKFLIVVIAFIAFYVVYNPGKDLMPIEKLDIPSGFGYDIEFDSNGQPHYSIPISTYVFKGEDKVLKKVHVGEGTTICETRGNRQTEETGKFAVGTEKVTIFSEASARYGIKSMIDILFANPMINDTALLAVYNGKAFDLLSLDIEGYTSSPDFLEGLIKNSIYFSFFCDNYKLMDIYMRLDAEGRNVKLPYIELINQKPKITGIAIFNKDKMVRKLDMQEAKITNFMLEDKAIGDMQIVGNDDKSICIYGKTKRKAYCKKYGEKYVFTINIDYAGEITNNSLYKELEKDPKVMRRFEADMAKKMETECYEFIDKMQNGYKQDLLELGMVAAAKYGRDTGTDWDEVVCNSQINVNVKIKVEKMGRGRF